MIDSDRHCSPKQLRAVKTPTNINLYKIDDHTSAHNMLNQTTSIQNDARRSSPRAINHGLCQHIIIIISLCVMACLAT